VAAIAAGIEPPLYAAAGGEDYELLAALPADFGDTDQRRFEEATGLAITRVGRMARGEGARFTLRGERVALAGFDHFR
jgi:thiamine monophosphate kinase